MQFDENRDCKLDCMFLQVYFVTIYLSSANSNIIQMLMKESVLSVFVRCAVMARGKREREGEGQQKGNKNNSKANKQKTKFTKDDYHS